MKISEIIRQLLDVMDRIEVDQQNDTSVQYHKDRIDDNVGRFNQVKDLVPRGPDMRQHANEPEEAYASVASVTTDAGGDHHHPADIRGEHASMFPNYQAK